MRIVFHLGAHGTDDERLLRCLVQNRGGLAEQGIDVPDPDRYRILLRDTAVQLRGRSATSAEQDEIIGKIASMDRASRMVLSWDNFLSYPQWALKGRLYPAGAERVRAFSRIFPDHSHELHLAIRNMTTFLPTLFARQRGKTFDEWLEGADPRALRWSDLVATIRAANPDMPITVWCDEDTPLIWPEVVEAVSGPAPGTRLQGLDDILSDLMQPEGMARLQSFLVEKRPTTVAQRRRVVGAFVEKFAIPDAIEAEIDVPGWTSDTLRDLDAAYAADIARLRVMDGVRFIAA